MCSEAAEVRMLDRGEVATCTAIYTEVKLEFVPHVDIADYRRMSATERAAVNIEGYAAYLAWRSANPELVADMEADARVQLAVTNS